MSLETICHYEIVRELAQGGMGVVHLGRDTRNGEYVAVKTLHHDLTGANGEWLTRFLREGKVLRDLNHPNIVKMLTLCEEAGQHYIVMEYLDGGSLAERMRDIDGLLPLDRVLDIALQMADALTRAHYLAIIHRDLKPANVLMSTDGRACITDFGIARTGESGLTREGAIMGTMGYLSPEVIQGREATERSDIWSFGIMLFEMLTGRCPFQGATPSATLYKILSEPPPDLESIRPEIPVHLVDLVYRMLEKDPERRISSIRQVGALLELIGRNEDDTLIQPDRGSGRFRTPDGIDPPRPTKRLPTEWTPFVGRKKEVAELTELLVGNGARLVTVIGQGGTGKTRLAIETARAIGGRFKHGVAFVTLDSLDSIDSLIPAIWEAADYPPVHADTRTPEEQTSDFFAEKEMLLLFDNCEHMLDGVELIYQLLRPAAGVRVLATTTERLNLQGETLYRIEGIDYPKGMANEEALSYAAVQLFIETSSRSRPGFEVTDENLPHIGRVCQLVQGHPLAIILASAWVDALSVEEIANEISDNLDLLYSEMRDIPVRQRSMRAVFEGAWRRLSADEQKIFMRLAIFRGGFDLDAARAITEANLRHLLSLTNKSLLRRNPTTGRYAIHRLLRLFAQEELDGSGELGDVQRRHAEYYVELAEKIDYQLTQPHDSPWYGRIRDENENFISALDWALVQENAPVIGGRLFAALGGNWFETDNVVDGTNWMKRALEYIEVLPEEVQARVYSRSGLVGCVQGNYAQAAGHHAQSVKILREIEGIDLLAFELVAQAHMSYAAGMGKELACQLAEESLTYAYRAETPFFLAFSLLGAAQYSRQAGDQQRARRLFSEANSLAEAFPNQNIRRRNLLYQAGEARREGDYELALAKYKDALKIARDTNRRSAELDTLQAMGYSHYLAGNLATAKPLLNDSLKQAREIAHFGLIAWALTTLGMVGLREGEDERAWTLFRERLQLESAKEIPWQIALSLAGMGQLAQKGGQEDVAAILLGASEIMVAAGGLLPFPWFTDEWQQMIGELKTKLNRDSWARGSKMSGQEAIGYALRQSNLP